MKRFVTYLYECERGNKGKNAGFIRMKVQKDSCKMEVYIRNISRIKDEGKIYALIYKEEMIGIMLGEVKILNGQSDSFFELKTENIMETGMTLSGIIGIGIQLESGGYIASCWSDAEEEMIVRGEFQLWRESLEIEVPARDSLWEKQVDSESALAVMEENQEQVEKYSSDEVGTNEFTIYEKIDLSQIRELPSPNWHLSTNSFLVHGFWNYGYLVLKKEMEEGKAKLSLGIPGIFEKPEAVMAILFGFPSFEEIPSEMVEADRKRIADYPKKEKNQGTEVGTFGCWFTELKV